MTQNINVTIKQQSNVKVRITKQPDIRVKINGTRGDSTGMYSPLGHTHPIDYVIGLSDALAAKANTVHTHEIDEVNGLQESLDSKSNNGHNHISSDIIDFNSSVNFLVDGKLTPVYSALDILDDSKSSIYHTHTASYITDFNSVVNGLIDTKNAPINQSINTLNNTVAGKANVVHTHVASSITDFNSTANGLIDAKLVSVNQAIAGKANTNHTHDYSAQFAAINHNHNTTYALLGHLHDTVYSPLNHTHDYSAQFAALNHTHDYSAQFAPINHNHNGTYSLINHTHNYGVADISGLSAALASKQATLISGTNIVTINGQSLLGSEDIIIQAATGDSVPAYQDILTATNGQTLFQLDNSSSGISIVSLNGILLTPVEDYSISGNDLTLTSPSEDGDKLVVNYNITSNGISSGEGGGGSIQVEDLIVNGVIDKAPSQNVVYDALLLKSDVGHTHEVSDVNGLQTALNNKASSTHTHPISEVDGLQTALNNKASSTHTHPISDVTGLQTALNNKASSTHTHLISEVDGLQTALNGKSDVGHNHNDIYYTKTEINSLDDGLTAQIELLDDNKQNNLISGTNIRTINNQSLLGSGDLSISALTVSGISKVQASLSTGKVCMWNAVGGTTTISAIGAGAFGIQGGATNTTLIGGNNRVESTRRVDLLATTVSSNAMVGYAVTQLNWIIGNNFGSNNSGGFYYSARFGPATGATLSTRRMFKGMSATAANIQPTDVNPSTWFNSIGVACDSEDTNLQFIYSNDTVVTKVDLGANFPKVVANRSKLYELIMIATPSSTPTLSFKLTDLDTGAVATLTVSTGFPAATKPLGPRGWVSVGGTSSEIGLTFVNVYMEDLSL
jgi:hypothetical protein